jgi:ThiF family protein
MGVDRPELPEKIREGRRAVDGVPGVILLGEPTWSEARNAWVQHCRLLVPVPPASAFPEATDWYVSIENAYPFGDIAFFPARVGGLAGTYWHQSHVGDGAGPWTSGKLCLSSSEGYPSRGTLLREPYEPSSRLAWHFGKAREWLVEASTGRLARSGELFELPDYAPDAQTVIAFCEDEPNLRRWRQSAITHGVALLVRIGEGPVVIRQFQAPDGTPIVTPAWGSLIADSTNVSPAGWVRVPSLPVLPPWKAPDTWAELRQAVAASGADLDSSLRVVLDRLRDDREHALLLGCEIPEHVDGLTVRMHWLPIHLGTPATTPLRGFRNNADGLWRRDARELFHGAKRVRWIRSENWAESDIGRRGRLPSRWRVARVLLLGAGAIGAAVAELLVRGGVRRISIVDADRVAGGNLLRHTLDLADVGVIKATALAERLNRLSPFCRAAPLFGWFPLVRTHEARSAQNEHNIVVDCTGSNDVIAALAASPWEQDTEFWSISVSGASRAYVFNQIGVPFDGDAFFRLIWPWVSEEDQRAKPVREGIGCWHAVFPARADEITLLASSCVSLLAATPLRQPTLHVLERIGAQVTVKTESAGTL